MTVNLDVSYRYGAARLNHEGSLLGRDAWSPAGPGDEGWYLASGDAVGMTMTLSVYGDGKQVATVPVFVPYLGRALAAEATAGTLQAPWVLFPYDSLHLPRPRGGPQPCMAPAAVRMGRGLRARSVHSL